VGVGEGRAGEVAEGGSNAGGKVTSFFDQKIIEANNFFLLVVDAQFAELRVGHGVVSNVVAGVKGCANQSWPRPDLDSDRVERRPHAKFFENLEDVSGVGAWAVIESECHTGCHLTINWLVVQNLGLINDF
jgi:hypothetical protein